MAFLCVLFLGYYLGSSGGYFSAQADRYAAQYPTETEQRVQRCFRAAQAPANVQECVNEAVEASHENQRSEQDLAAQRQMAQWAFWLLIITVLQVPIGVAGILALIVTIRQGSEGLKQSTRAAEAAEKALQHASKTSEVQLRAYINVGGENFKIDKGELPRKIYFELPFKNIGETPAHRVTVLSEVSFHMYSQAITEKADLRNAPDRIKHFTTGITSFGTVPKGTEFKIIIPEIISSRRIRHIEKGLGVFVIDVSIPYVDEFGHPWLYKHGFYVSHWSILTDTLHTLYCEASSRKKTKKRGSRKRA